MRNSQKGFTLVEIMVALVIGLIAMVVVMQVFNLSETRKRSTTGGSDAQANGAVSFFMIERDVKMAGWGLDTGAYRNCTNIKSYCNGSASCGGGTGTIAGLSFASVQITDGASGGPDTVTAQFFSNPASETYRVPAVSVLKSPLTMPADDITATSVAGCAVGDLILLQEPTSSPNAGQCSLVQATTVTPATLKIQHDTTGPFNPSAAEQLAGNWTKHVANASMACIKKPVDGPFFKRTYAIDTAQRALTRSDNSGATVQTNEVVTPEIVDMQAQYGIAPANSQVINQWVDATTTWVSPSMVDIKRIKAVRIALLARSAQYEKPVNSTTACVSTTDAMAAKWSTWATFKTSAYPADWHCYQYKSFETVIPLRNVIWSNL